MYVFFVNFFFAACNFDLESIKINKRCPAIILSRVEMCQVVPFFAHMQHILCNLSKNCKVVFGFVPTEVEKWFFQFEHWNSLFISWVMWLQRAVNFAHADYFFHSSWWLQSIQLFYPKKEVWRLKLWPSPFPQQAIVILNST